MNNTIEEKILKHQEKKRQLVGVDQEENILRHEDVLKIFDFEKKK